MTIDLGEARDEMAAGPRPPRRRPSRALAVAGVVVALLATSGAAAPVRPVLVEQLISAAQGGQAYLLGDVLVLVRTRQPAGTLTVEAYRADDGELAWRWSVPEAGGLGPVRTAAGVLLITVHDDDQRAHTVAVQPTTGRQLWRRPGWSQEGAAGQVILQEETDQQGRSIDPRLPPAGVPVRLEAVAAATGQVRWSLLPYSDEVVNVVADRLVRWSPSGRVEVRDLGTGRMLAAAALPVPDMPPSTPAVQVTDRLLLVNGLAGGQRVATAYGLDRLDRRWQAPIDLGEESVSDDCGDVVCMARLGGGVRLVDAATGETRWSDPRWGRLRRAGPYLLADEPMPSEQQTPVVVLDPATGDVVADLGRWSVTEPAGDGRMAAVRHDSGTHRAVIAVLDPAAARARVAGVATDVGGCAPDELAITCRRLDGSVLVWRPPVWQEW